MRLVETLSYPLSTQNPGNVQVFSTAPPAITIFSLDYGSFNNASPSKVKAFFNPPRLGRALTVDRVTVNPNSVLLTQNSATAIGSLAFNFQLLLNDVYVSDVSSLIYSVPLAAPADLTIQNVPLTIQPYNSIEILPGDQLSVEFTTGYVGSGMTTLITQSTLVAKFGLSLVGGNDPHTRQSRQ